MGYNFPSTEELEKMSIEQIRALYPQSPVEEEAMQKVLDQKRLVIPITDLLDRTDVPDIRNQADEAKWQKVMDERQRKIDVQFKGEAFLEKELADLEKEKQKLGFEEEIAEKKVEEVVVVAPKEKKVHCEECGSLSPAFHRKGCSKKK